MEVGDPDQVGEATHLGGVTHLSITYMITWDDPPKRVAQVSLSVGVKFCYVNVTRWGNLSSRGLIRGTSIAQKLK